MKSGDRSHGRPLYLYRLSSTEFEELEELLRCWLGKLLDQFSLAQLTRLDAFSALFVLYGAEWWRRRYDGSGFSWEPLLEDLGADPEDWSPSQRSDCVVEGFREWGLKPRSSGALRFLGSVAVQGGLPLRLVSEARGRTWEVLSRVLHLAGKGQSTQGDIQTWVESLGHVLPKSYRQATIFTLLADVAWTVLLLKKQAGLRPGGDAIATLDKNIAGWRDRLPLAIDDAHAQGLLNQLVRDAANVKTERKAVCLPVERFLEGAPGEGWVLRSQVFLSDTLDFDSLATLLGATQDALPRTGELSLSAGEQRQGTTLRRLAGHASYRVERKPWGASAACAASEHVLRLTAGDGCTWVGTAARGEPLEDELPWVFSAEDAGIRFARQGSGGITGAEGYVAVPPGWRLLPRPEADAKSLGQMHSPAREIFHIRGVVEADDGAGSVYRIRTGHAASQEESFEWVGDRFWLDFRNPGTAFRGLPELYRVDEEGNRRKAEGRLSWNAPGASALERPLGPVIVRWPEFGAIERRARMVVLPATASVRMEPHDASSGVLKLVGWNAVDARVLTANVHAVTKRDGNDLILSLNARNSDRVPERVEIEALWPHSSKPARLTMPFPTRGARAFRANGEEITSGALIASGQIPGTRLLVLGGKQATRMILEIGADHGTVARMHDLKPSPDSAGIEIRLQDHAADINHMLSMNDSAYATAQVVLRLGGIEEFRLNVARYAATLRKDGSRVCLEPSASRQLGPDALGALGVSALMLERPGDEPVALDGHFSEDVASGCWEFLPETREPGSWLLFPDSSSTFPFHATLWPIGGKTTAESALAQAIGISDQDERETMLDEVLTQMTLDLVDPCWIEVEQLAGQTAHLPLSTLDLWRRFARQPRAMAALALRFSSLPDGFVDRFDQELPFAWEAVPFEAWRDAARGLQRQCRNSFGEDAGASLFQIHLDSRIKDITAIHGALAFLLGIVKAEFDADARQQKELLRITAEQTAKTFFEEKDSDLMRLQQIHADDEWPEDFNWVLKSPEFSAVIAPRTDPRARRASLR
ncbi:MAG: STY4851/ECs_5259 family protein [Gammaproteobacteria bacterium]|nr:STY4851/ECs_5259 family protein [Gammaproteobacteria bacterium]